MHMLRYVFQISAPARGTNAFLYTELLLYGHFSIYLESLKVVTNYMNM